MAKTGLILFLLAILGTTSPNAQDVTLVKYPKGATQNDARTAIGMKAVALALRATEQDYGPWRLDLFPIHMERRRRENSLEHGEKANVLMLPGKDEYDVRFILVPIPIDRGLLGYRVALISAQQKDILKSVLSKNDLAQLTGCSLKPWNITQTFAHNNLKLALFTRYEAMFSALEFGRCDYFSRSVGEIMREYRQFKRDHPDLEIDPHMMVKTELAEYLYVNKDHPELAERLHEGLKRAHADGSYERFFEREYGDYIRDLNLGDRHVISMKSPAPHQNAPRSNADYWYKN